jgi:nicotinamidase-related amidase
LKISLKIVLKEYGSLSVLSSIFKLTKLLRFLVQFTFAKKEQNMYMKVLYMNSRLLNPTNCTLILIDYQPEMIFAVGSLDGVTLINNAVGLAKAAKLFKVPIIMTSVAEKSFSGAVIEQLQKVITQKPYIDRTTMNCWEDTRVVDAVKKAGRKKIILAGLWTEVCIALAALSALEQGYEVYVVVDACAGTTKIAHKTAIQRIIQAGGTPITWMQYMLELQRDWARQETYTPVMQIATEHGGSYGVGIQFAHALIKN